MSKNRSVSQHRFLFKVLLLIGFAVAGGWSLQAAIRIPEPSLPAAPPLPPRVVKLLAVGDIMAHMPQVRAAYDKKNKTYDFLPPLAAVKGLIEQSDIAIGNLETTFTPKRDYSGYPKFNTPKELARDLKKAGFDVLVTANNHSLDYGEKGILGTIDVLQQNGLRHAGTSVSKDTPAFTIVEKGGIRIAVMSYTCKTNGHRRPKGKQYLLNVYSKALAAAEVKQARAQNVDLLLCYIHFGEEYERFPDTSQYAVVRELQQAGFNIIIGSHPHVLQPDQAKLAENSYAVYSLGNFISSQKRSFTDIGMILEFSIRRNPVTGSARILEVRRIPTYTRRVKGKTSVVPLATVDETLTKRYRKQLTYNKTSLYKDVIGHMRGGLYLE